ncbi:hypothetical protein [Pseudomonas sp.]|uniref:hypothetical protein n=1 Tax=Pseudomonas sp. TaxID=306 RepID=UPI0028A7FB76|nr:hypothetical protein [Pseudomonas sp.]
MPRLNITCAPLPALQRKQLALDFTRELKAIGADAGHCLVFFKDLTESCAFRAGMPLPILDHDAQPAHFHLHLTVSAQRPQAVLDALATSLRECLYRRYPNAFIYLEFDPIQPVHVYYGAGAQFTNAGYSQGTSRP